MLNYSSLFVISALFTKKRLYILLADDDDDGRYVFAEIVEEISTDIQVGMAIDGNMLMQLLAKKDLALPDIIFLDINMPGKNGLECLEEIRSNTRLKDIPVIVYSNCSNPAEIDAAFNNGARAYLTKTDSFALLKQLLKKIFQIDWAKNQLIDREEFVLNPVMHV